jgi:hypothetical protein
LRNQCQFPKIGMNKNNFHVARCGKLHPLHP